MQKQECLGCRRYFQQTEKLSPTNNYEFRMYAIPMKEHKERWSLLKSIVSLMNFKGGTIFIGVEQSGEIHGIKIERKQKDDFMIFIQQLTSRIKPEADLSDKEEIIVHFVPILRKEQATGKYVIKIIVQQGDPTQTYCFSQKIQFQNHQDKKSVEEFEVLYSFKKNNLGTCIEYKGLELLQEVRRKALNPSKISDFFHENCNPSPLMISLEISKIGFSNISNPETRKKLEKWFKLYLKEQKIDEDQSHVGWSDTNKMIMVEINDGQKFKDLISFVEKNINILNSSLSDCRFIKDRQSAENFQVFINQLEQKHENKGKIQKEVMESFQGSGKKQKPLKQRFKKNLCITFTHISPKSSKDLCSKIEALYECPKEMKIYVNSIEVFFTNKEDYETFANLAQIQKDQLAKYGFNSEIIVGHNLGIIEIRNYNNQKYNQLRSYIEEVVGKDLKACNFKKKGNKFSMMVEFKAPFLGCKWLDCFLTDRCMRDFQIPGAEKSQQPKMKYHLLCPPLQQIQGLI